MSAHSKSVPLQLAARQLGVSYKVLKQPSRRVRLGLEDAARPAGWMDLRTKFVTAASLTVAARNRALMRDALRTNSQ